MSLLGKIEGIAGTLGGVLAGDVRATLETNLAPPVTVYGGSGRGGGVLSALGVRGGVVVRDSEGRVIARLGDPVPFEPLRALLVVGGAVLVLVVLVAAVRRMAR
jgi:hypothetical protein